MGAKAAILIHLFSMAMFITLLVAYIIHGLIYPRVSGTIPLGPHTVDYKVGRVPFFSARKFFVKLYYRWQYVPDLNGFLQSSVGRDLKCEDKSYWTHLLDCGLLYPALYVYVYAGLDWLLFG